LAQLIWTENPWGRQKFVLEDSIKSSDDVDKTCIDKIPPGHALSEL